MELPKFTLALGELVDPEQKWVYFLKHGDQMSREQAQALGIPEIAEAERKLTMISQDQLLQMQHEQWDKALRDQVARELDWIEHGRREGQKEGERKGLQQGIRTLCDVLAIPLTPQREQALAALDAAALQALLTTLQQTRRWD